MILRAERMSSVPLVSLIWLRDRWIRVFAAYAGASYVLFAVVQNTADVPGLGRGIVTNNVAMFLCVALAWFLEAASGKTKLQAMSFKLSRSWVIVPAALAAWYPIDWKTMMPDFSPAHFVPRYFCGGRDRREACSPARLLV